MPIIPETCSACEAGGGGGFAPTETLVMGPATGTFTDVTGTYAVPAEATMVLFEGVAGGGGGASGGTVSVSQTGGGGGGGAGKSQKWVPAAALRAAYPGGVPFNVGHGGAGAPANTVTDTNGTNGGVGGFTFAGDFFAATPGNYYSAAVGGGPGGNGNGTAGSAGRGDILGCIGGQGGSLAQFYTADVSTDFTGGGGGYPNIMFGLAGTYVTTDIEALGGGGGGGGGGGVDGSHVAYNGGPSGFATTVDPTPLAGAGGIVGGALPTTAGAPSVFTSAQGGGGGGASGTSANGQRGADALAGSGSGGGGGGSSYLGNGGGGGNGGSGYLRIVAF